MNTHRIPPAIVVLLAALPAQAADVFDRHTSEPLRKAAEAAQPLDRLTLDEAGRLQPLGPAVGSPCIVVKTGDGNWTKALVAWGFRKGPNGPVPVLLLERYVTYRGDRGDVTAAAGKEVMLFAGFSFNFDIGQVVPDGQGGDIRFTAESVIESLDQAELYALDGPQLPDNGDEPAAGPSGQDGVAPGDFSGTWTVDVDGRWRGEWSLTVDENGRAKGTFLSQESRSNYPITGRVAALPHHLKLQVQLENAQQQIEAYLWTADESRMAGTATLAGRTFGFTAVRQQP